MIYYSTNYILFPFVQCHPLVRGATHLGTNASPWCEIVLSRLPHLRDTFRPSDAASWKPGPTGFQATFKSDILGVSHEITKEEYNFKIIDRVLTAADISYFLHELVKCLASGTMTLLTRINLALSFVFLIALGITSYIIHTILQENAKREVITHAGMMMEASLAVRSYTINEVKPLLVDKLEKTFLPQTVPSYAATQNFNKLRENHPEYIYKEATLNPTNPRDRAGCG